ncbi:MAG: hypothetical protein QGG40_13100, partial [Myxococcota bacterium]|nr:hypothetical protein [Myxococcota bacterium]
LRLQAHQFPESAVLCRLQNLRKSLLHGEPQDPLQEALLDALDALQVAMSRDPGTRRGGSDTLCELKDPELKQVDEALDAIEAAATQSRETVDLAPTLRQAHEASRIVAATAHELDL